MWFPRRLHGPIPATVSCRELAARAADGQTVTPSEVRVIQDRVEENSREAGHLGARVAALEENRGELKQLGAAVAGFELVDLHGFSLTRPLRN